MSKLKWGMIGGGEGSQIGPAHRLGAQADGLFEFAAGGFQDISRTASSDATMWHDVFMSNKDNVLKAVEQFERINFCKRLKFSLSLM